VFQLSRLVGVLWSLNAEKAAESHDNSQITLLTNILRGSCSVQQNGGFNTDTSTYTSSPREIRNIVRGLRNVTAAGDDAINISFLKNLSRKALYFWPTCSMVVWNYHISLPNGSTRKSSQHGSLGPFKRPSYKPP
jgi:hypothetical protein